MIENETYSPPSAERGDITAEFGFSHTPFFQIVDPIGWRNGTEVIYPISWNCIYNAPGPTHTESGKCRDEISK